MKYLKIIAGVTISIVAIASLTLHFKLPRLGVVTQTRTVSYDTTDNAYDFRDTQVFPQEQGVYAYLATPSSTTCTDADTYYFVNGTFTNEILSDFIIDGGIKYQGTVTTSFEIALNATLTSDTINTVVSIALFKNGVLQDNSIMSTEVDKLTDRATIPLVDVLPLATNDVIDIRLKCNKAGVIIINETITTMAQKFY